MKLRTTLLVLLLLGGMTVQATERVKLNFNGGWRLTVGDVKEASKPDFDDTRWEQVTLPYAFNGDEAFKKDIVNLTDTISWYRKTFKLAAIVNKKVFIEFEGVARGPTFI